MPRVGLAARNVFVYDETNNTTVADCRQFGSTTISEFFYCLNFFVGPIDGEYQLFHRETSSYLARDDANILPIGTYFVVSLGATILKCWLILLANPPSYLSVTLSEEEARSSRVPGGSPNTTTV